MKPSKVAQKIRSILTQPKPKAFDVGLPRHQFDAPSVQACIDSMVNH